MQFLVFRRTVRLMHFVSSIIDCCSNVIPIKWAAKIQRRQPVSKPFRMPIESFLMPNCDWNTIKNANGIISIFSLIRTSIGMNSTTTMDMRVDVELFCTWKRILRSMISSNVPIVRRGLNFEINKQRCLFFTISALFDGREGRHLAIMIQTDDVPSDSQWTATDRSVRIGLTLTSQTTRYGWVQVEMNHVNIMTQTRRRLSLLTTHWTVS